MTFAAVDLIGVAGAAFILFGFFRINSGKWTNKSFWYELDNLVGASLLLTYHFIIRTYPSMVLNIVWIIVAFKGLTSFAERRRNKSEVTAKTDNVDEFVE